MSQWEPDPRHDFATEVVRTLTEAGYIAYFAGGCVRDELLGLRAKDYDVATDARPSEVRALFGRKRTLAIGAAFGVVAVVGRKKRGEGIVEVATFRTDGVYSDGRRPDQVEYSTPQHDAERRDFTINGMFFNPLAGEVIDYVGGQRDLQRQVIRAIGDPERRFAEDHLRLLRAVRFATTLGFHIEPETWEAVRRNATKIRSVSGERIAVELEKIFHAKGGARGLEQLDLTGLLRALLPEMYGRDHEGNEQKIADAARLLSVAGRCDLTLGLSCLLAAAISPDDQPSVIKAIGRRFKLSNEVKEGVRFSLAAYRQMLEADRLPWSQVQPLLIHRHAETAVMLAECWAGAHDAAQGGVAFCTKRLEWDAARLNPPPLIDGRQLMAMGLTPGPRFKELLAEVRALQLDETLASREEAEAWVRKRER